MVVGRVVVRMSNGKQLLTSNRMPWLTRQSGEIPRFVEILILKAQYTYVSWSFFSRGIYFNTITIPVVDGCVFLSLVLFFWEIRPLPLYLPSYNTRCRWEWLRWLSFTFFASILFVVTMWHREKTSRPKDRKGFVEGNYFETNFPLEFFLSPLHGLHQ